ncbi:MAG: hypothetical protein ACK6EB_43850, partial [Planctomyces sp.]
HSARSVLIDAQTVHFDGVLQTTAETTDTNDYEVRVLADSLRLTGSFSVQGSIEIQTPTTPEIYNFSAAASGSSARILLRSDADLNIGRLTLNERSQWISQPAKFQASQGIAL